MSSLYLFQPNQDPYCFVEFYDHESAAAALAAMNKRMCLGRVSIEIRKDNPCVWNGLWVFGHLE